MITVIFIFSLCHFLFFFLFAFCFFLSFWQFFSFCFSSSFLLQALTGSKNFQTTDKEFNCIWMCKEISLHSKGHESPAHSGVQYTCLFSYREIFHWGHVWVRWASNDILKDGTYELDNVSCLWVQLILCNKPEQ